eukprot:jgi/Botrbrau1/19497/Bobra.0786s0002.1
MVWALATRQHSVGPELLDEISLSALTHMHSASSFAISILLWGIAKISTLPAQVPGTLEEGELVEASIRQLTWLMPEIRASQDLANALWALATVTPILRRPLSQEALADLSGPWADTALALFTGSDENGAPLIQPQHMSNILWAYAQLRIMVKDGDLLRLGLKEILRKPSAFSVEELVAVVWSAAVLRCPLPEGAAAVLVRCVLDNPSRADPQALCNMCWALAVLGELDQATLCELVGALSHRLSISDAENLTLENATQLLRADEAVSGPRAKVGCTTGEGRVSCLPTSLELRARRLVLSSISDSPTTQSPLLEGVSRALEVLGVPHSVSWRTPDGLLAVDVLVPRQAPHPPLALLVDGPWHFRALPPYEPLGRSELRNRLLAARGYGVLVIPWFDWDAAVSQGRDVGLQFLQAKLQSAGFLVDQRTSKIPEDAVE